MLFIASTLMWTCNTMYIIDMPLWISSDLGLPDKLAGILMGDGRRAGNSGDDSGGILRQTSRETPDDADNRSGRSAFLPGADFLHSREALLALQLFNAVFIGIVAGMRMLWFQDLMPGRAGSATT